MKKAFLYAFLLSSFVSFTSSAAWARDIVVIGDSLTCGTLGWHLFHTLSPADSVSLFCTVSSSPPHWLKGENPAKWTCVEQSTDHPKVHPCGGTGDTPMLQNLLNEHPHAAFIVILGSNSLGGRQVDKSYARMAGLIEKNGNPCLWAGPPEMNPAQASPLEHRNRVAKLNQNLPDFYESLAEAVDPYCKLVDSRISTAEGTAGHQTVDGIHRTDKAGKAWAEAIISEL